MDPRTGDVIASVGGVDPRVSAFDRTRAVRQPGSAIKPFLYLSALDYELDPMMDLSNFEQTYTDWNGVKWSPKNYDHSQTGGMPMLRALEQSSNLAAADLINRIGVASMARVAEAAGVYEPGAMRPFMSSALGASETTLMNLVSGYAAILNDGVPRRPKVIAGLSSSDSSDKLRPEHDPRGYPIARRSAVSDIISMMRGVITRGTASVAFSRHPVMLVGKTGTTQDHRDAWFIGVTPHLAIGVWLGKDDNTSLPGKTAGGSDAAPIAARILQDAFDAGLITSDGYRDQKFSSGTAWPPSQFGSEYQSGDTYQVGTPDGGDNFFLETGPDDQVLKPNTGRNGGESDAVRDIWAPQDQIRRDVGESGYFGGQN